MIVLGLGLLPGTVQAADPSCPMTSATPAASSNSAPLRFGIYPGGPAGSVSTTAPPKPEDPLKRAAALQQLAGGKPFVVHLYTGFSGDPAKDAGTEQWLDGEIAGYTASGLQVELVTRYEPRGADAATNVAGFTAHVRRLVQRYGADPAFVALQVGNEANLAGAAAASDGAYPGAMTALVNGVIAAKDEVARSGHGQVRIGFNWAYDERTAAAGDFFQALGRLGGSAFARSVDWVGLDAYPGTWTPQLTLGATLPSLAADAIVKSLQTLRSCLMPMAGLDSGVPIRIAENGFPTGTGRTPAMQADALSAMVRVVDGVRGRFNVTDYRWFDLRDSVSGDGNFESQYGITRDDYTPKAAFWTYRDLVAELAIAHGGPTAPPARGAVDTPGGTAASSAGCRPSPVRIVLPTWPGKKLQAVDVRSGPSAMNRVSAKAKSVRVAMQPGVRRVSVRQVATGKGGRSVTRTVRQTVTVCNAAGRRAAARRAALRRAARLRAAARRA